MVEGQNFGRFEGRICTGEDIENSDFGIENVMLVAENFDRGLWRDFEDALAVFGREEVGRVVTPDKERLDPRVNSATGLYVARYVPTCELVNVQLLWSSAVELRQDRLDLRCGEPRFGHADNTGRGHRL